MCKPGFMDEGCGHGDCDCSVEDQAEMLELNKKVLEARIKCLDRRIARLKKA
jgi:hypothetical protein